MPLILSRPGQLVMLALAGSLLTACSSTPAPDSSLHSKAQHSTIQLQGVPGGVYTKVESITATVTAIDYQSRQVSLQDPLGNQRTLHAGPNVQQLERVKVGDRVHANAAEETAVFLQGRGVAADDGIIERLLREAKSGQPGLAMSGSEQVTARVVAVDLAQHSATLQYPNGKQRTFAVRPDVALSPSSVGSQVVIRTTTAMLIRVEKP